MRTAYEPEPEPDTCPRCDGDGEVRTGQYIHTCPICRGSGLSGPGEAELRAEEAR